MAVVEVVEVVVEVAEEEVEVVLVVEEVALVAEVEEVEVEVSSFVSWNIYCCTFNVMSHIIIITCVMLWFTE